jgi:hypothetical protein
MTLREMIRAVPLYTTAFDSVRDQHAPIDD